MKILLQLCLIFFISVSVKTQNSYLELNNKLWESIKIIEDGKRVQIETINQEKLHGKLRIVNDSMLAIQDNLININDINYIKKNPLGLNIIGKLIFVGGGLFLVVFGSWATWFFIGLESGITASSIISALIVTSGATFTSIGLLNRNVFTKKLYVRNWECKVVQVE